MKINDTKRHTATLVLFRTWQLHCCFSWNLYVSIQLRHSAAAPSISYGCSAAIYCWRSGIIPWQFFASCLLLNSKHAQQLY